MTERSRTEFQKSILVILPSSEDARAKAAAVVLQALEAPKPRTRTRPTRASQARRVEAKKQAGEKKRQRRGDWE